MGLFSTSKFYIRFLSRKIDIICFQNLGSFGVRLPNVGTDMSHCRVLSHRLVSELRIFSATFFLRSDHILTHSHNQKPQNTRYQNSNLAPSANVGTGRFLGRFSRGIRFLKIYMDLSSIDPQGTKILLQIIKAIST